MASFMSRTMDSVTGTLLAPMSRVVTDTTSGVDGATAIDAGAKPQQQQVTTVEAVADQAAKVAAKAAYEALVGAIGTVVDDDGESVANVLVQGLANLDVQRALTAVGFTAADPDYVITATWNVSVRS